MIWQSITTGYQHDMDLLLTGTKYSGQTNYVEYNFAIV